MDRPEEQHPGEQATEIVRERFIVRIVTRAAPAKSDRSYLPIDTAFL
jgi:hypothetical protein